MKRIPILFAFLGIVVSAVHADDTMRVHFIDVGQGDATLLEFDCGAILIDTGGESNDAFNSEEVLEQYLDAFFDDRSDLNGELTALYLTHPHIDHTRGAEMVIENYRPRNVITNGQEHDTGGNGDGGQVALHEFAEATHATPRTSDDVGLETVSITEISPGAGLINKVVDPLEDDDCDPELAVLWGEVRVKPHGWNNEEYHDENNHSVVLRVDFGEASLLLTGDLEDDAIETFLEFYEGSLRLLDTDVYQAGHHGSRNGTTPALLRAITPELAVISMGPAHRELSWTAYQFGHPNVGILDQLQGAIAQTRPEVEVLAGHGSRTFSPYTVTQAVYATGWDGTIVLEAERDGNWTVIEPDGNPLGPPRPFEIPAMNINTATQSELETLPGIGPVKARRIIEYRDQHGPFESVDAITNVRGIGAGTLRDIRALISVE